MKTKTACQLKTGDRVMYAAHYAALFATNEKRKLIKSERGEVVYADDRDARFVTVAWGRSGRTSMISTRNLAIAPE
jgi:hypothetical protein